ncbi:hypothetical protein E2K80_04875 [Rhodophyticola sp. CCM32]|uniref:hypothetical protein n=1 Tax=Rhodophyticola sp. CCM32 TaxID=2916397 RepID=UPI00107F07B6|nr:hypothetical protein [Rhodophyticola sp. CCM32]QBY00151.1 hypothetical protein E2K80_04875 [Rhodophyticola sp. CCM32]
MKMAENLWLGALTAQQNLLHIVNFSGAFYGTAALQGLNLGLSAPLNFWSALSRVDAPREANLDTTPLDTAPPEEAAPSPPMPEPVAMSSPHLLDAPRGGVADDLTSISGIGAKLALTLNEFGIYHYDQIATLDETGIDWLNNQQSGFKALVARFDLIGQAKDLTAG